MKVGWRWLELKVRRVLELDMCVSFHLLCEYLLVLFDSAIRIYPVPPLRAVVT